MFAGKVVSRSARIHGLRGHRAWAPKRRPWWAPVGLSSTSTPSKGRRNRGGSWCAPAALLVVGIHVAAPTGHRCRSGCDVAPLAKPFRWRLRAVILSQAAGCSRGMPDFGTPVVRPGWRKASDGAIHVVRYDAVVESAGAHIHQLAAQACKLVGGGHPAAAKPLEPAVLLEAFLDQAHPPDQPRCCRAA